MARCDHVPKSRKKPTRIWPMKGQKLPTFKGSKPFCPAPQHFAAEGIAQNARC